jgi:hypothetical protein
MSQIDGALLKLLQARHGQASRKEKGQILDEFVRTTDCHRKNCAGRIFPSIQQGDSSRRSVVKP